MAGVGLFMKAWLTRAAFGVVAVVLASCASEEMRLDQAGSPATVASETPGGTSPTTEESRPAWATLFPSRRADEVILEPHFDVFWCRLPGGMVSQSERIWNLTEELWLSPEQSVQLRRNGLRAGLLAESSWTAVRAILESADVRWQSASQTLRYSDYLSLKIGRHPDLAPVFAFAPDGTLYGGRFLAGARYFHIAQVLPGRDLSLRQVIIVPEVRTDDTGRQLRMIEGQPRYERVYQGRIFNEARVQVGVPDGYLLLLGPSRAAQDVPIVGQGWLTGESDGEKYDTIICVALRLHWSGRTAAR